MLCSDGRASRASREEVRRHAVGREQAVTKPPSAWRQSCSPDDLPCPVFGRRPRPSPTGWADVRRRAGRRLVADTGESLGVAFGSTRSELDQRTAMPASANSVGVGGHRVGIDADAEILQDGRAGPLRRRGPPSASRAVVGGNPDYADVGDAVPPQAVEQPFSSSVTHSNPEYAAPGGL